MRRTHRTLIMLALGLALGGGTTAAAAATQSDERKSHGWFITLGDWR